MVLEHELRSFEEICCEETVILVIIALFGRQFNFLDEPRSVQAHHTKHPLLRFGLLILAKHNILLGFAVLLEDLELELWLLLMKFDEEVTLEPVAQLCARGLIYAQSVAHVGLARALVCVNLEVANPGATLTLNCLSVVICVA